MAQPWLRQVLRTAKVLVQSPIVIPARLRAKYGFPTATWLVGAMGTARIPPAYVLDSFTMLSHFGDEPGADMVGQ